MPDWGPFGDTRREARLLAISDALLLKSPAGGKVELVLTVATQGLRDFPRDEFVSRHIAVPIRISRSRIAALPRISNTLMPVRRSISTAVRRSAGFLKHTCDEMDQTQIVDPGGLMLQIDVGEGRGDEEGPQVALRNFSLEP